MPRVSVIIPTYNSRAFIGRTLNSILTQTYGDYEIIVADDGSSDGTQVALEPWAGKITYIHQQNRGPSAARNFAVSRAVGEFLAYVDADDMWYPRKLEWQVNYLDNHPECGIVHGEVTVIDDCDNTLYARFDRDHNRRGLEGACGQELLRQSIIHMPTVIERRVCFDQAGGFDERISYGEDYLHWLEVVFGGHRLGYMDEPLAYYRHTSGSLSQSGTSNIRMAESLLHVYQTLLNPNERYCLTGSQEEAIIQEQIRRLRCDLAYQYRDVGANGTARRHALAAILECPGRLDPYIELLKAWVPTGVARRLRELRG